MQFICALLTTMNQLFLNGNFLGYCFVRQSTKAYIKTGAFIYKEITSVTKLI